MAKRVISRTLTRPAGLAEYTVEKAHLNADVEDRDEKIRELHAQVSHLSMQSRRLSEQLTLREVDLRNLQTTFGERTAWSERLTQEASAREALVRELQLQLGERSAWAFRMVEGLVDLHSGQSRSEGADHRPESASAPTADVAKTAIDFASGMDPQHLAAVVAQQTAEVASLQRQLAAVEADLNATREAAGQLETTLSEERGLRQRLEEAAKRDYEHLKRRLKESIEKVIPRSATILMVSRGDDALAGSNGRKVWHFPQTEDGVWAGHDPADAAEAIAHLETLRAKGGAYLVFPATARWWLEHYHDFQMHLRTRYRTVLDREDTATIFDVTEPPWQRRIGAAIAAFEERLGREPALLDCHSGLELAVVYPRHAVFSPPTSSSTLPYLDRSIDISVCPRTSVLMAEARRVTSGMVVTIGRPRTNGSGSVVQQGRGTSVRIEWIGAPAPRQSTARVRSGSAAVRPRPAPVSRTRERTRRGQR